MRPRNLLAALTVVLVASLNAQAEPKRITTVEGITEYRLDNGLKVLVFPDSSKPTVTVNLTIFVGSRHEGYGEAGMAHLLEHMLFKGTPTHKDIPQLLKDRGANFNGTTWLDRTNYYETLPARDDNLEFALKLEADRMINSNVANEDLHSEFSVVRSEFERGETSPIRVLWQRMSSASFLWHNYGNSTIGNRADIERVPIQNLKRFYRKYYQPDNAQLVIAGKFETEDALKLTEKYFGSIPKPERQLDQTYTVEPSQDGERLVTIRRVGDVAAVGALYHIPAGPHPEYPAVDVMNSMLAAEPAGRLYKRLVETKRASSIYGLNFALHDPGIIMFISEVPSENDPQAVVQELLDVVEGFGESEIKEEDVARARRQLLKNWELASTNSTALAVELSEWAAQGDWRLYFLYRDRLEKVGVDDVRHVAKSYFKRNNRTVGMYLPAKEADRVSVPETPNLAEMIGDYKGRKAIARGEAFDVSPENIETRTRRGKLNGDLRVAILPKKTRGNTVVLRLTLRYGDAKSLNGLVTACEMLPGLMRRGTEKLDRQAIQDELDKNLAQLSASGSAGSATFTLNTKRDNLPAALGILRQVLRSPTLPEEELEIRKNEIATAVEQQKTQPVALAQNAVLRALNPFDPGHPLYINTMDQEIAMTKMVSRDQIKKVYDEFLGASHGELSIVGDFDPQTTMPILAQMLQGWTSKSSYARIERPGKVDYKPGLSSIETPDQANAAYFAASLFPLKDDNPDYPALLMGNYILGGGALANRLGNRVRQKDGLSYTIASNVSVSSLDERTLFYIFAISNPANSTKVVKAIEQEIARIRKDGITEKELAAAKKGWLQSQSVGRSNDGSLASTLSSTSLAGRTMDYYAGLETKIGSLTVEQVNEVLKKHIDSKKLVISTAGDFAAVSKDGSGDESGADGKKKDGSK